MCMAKEVIEIADQAFVAFLCGETGCSGMRRQVEGLPGRTKKRHSNRQN